MGESLDSKSSQKYELCDKLADFLPKLIKNDMKRSRLLSKVQLKLMLLNLEMFNDKSSLRFDSFRFYWCRRETV